MAFLATVACKIATRYDVPNSIPTSPPGSDNTDVYVLQLLDNELTRFTANRRSTNRGLQGLWFEGIGQGGFESSVPFSSIPEFGLRFEHHYKGFHFSYTTPIAFLLHHFFNVASLYRVYNWLAQLAFNRKRLVREGRVSILRFIHERTLDDRDFRTSSIDLMTQMFSLRWVMHPDRSRTQGHYSLILRSLLLDGDLESVGNSYRLSPKALSTLATFEEEDRRHAENRRRQTILAFLTFALILIGIPQAIAAAIQAYQYFHPLI